MERRIKTEEGKMAEGEGQASGRWSGKEEKNEEGREKEKGGSHT